MANLADEIKDVPVDSSPIPESETPDPVEEETPASEETSEVSETKKEEDRIYNLQREMDRKLEKQQSDFLASQERLMETVLEKVATISQAPKAPSTLDEMSLVQLQDLRREVAGMENPDPAALAQIDGAIVDRRVTERVNSSLGAFTEEQRVHAQRESAKVEALSKYPDLRNPNSDFYKAVDKSLRLRGDTYIKTNPQAVLDIAARVAVDMGVKPIPRTPIPSVARSKTAPAPGEEKPQVTETIKKLRSVYQQALPDGKKFTDEQLQRIAERAANYSQQGAKTEFGETKE